MSSREQLAKDNGMTIEFVNWFFDNKKDGCGNVWFVMMAAMWEGWNGREAKCAALAAENAGLKSFGNKLDEMHNDLNGEGTGIQGRAEVACQQVALEAAMEEFDAIKTPDTDAFLAEVRAQAWIEGNEPAEFGRYWVRYETDVGPQYCSAKWMEHNFCAGSDTNIHKIWLADHSRSINSLNGVTHYTMLPEPIEGGAK